MVGTLNSGVVSQAIYGVFMCKSVLLVLFTVLINDFPPFKSPYFDTKVLNFTHYVHIWDLKKKERENKILFMVSLVEGPP